MTRIATTLTSIARGLRAVLGAPDYERYLDHIVAAHPGTQPMSLDEFQRERMENRYNNPGSRCC